MSTRFDVCIVGAGPAGSSAAILLASSGLSVALFEKQEFPRRKVCGECIAASNLPLFRAMGVAEAVDAAAGPDLTRMALSQGMRTVRAGLPAASDPEYPYARALGREVLDLLLLERARAVGAEVFQPYSVESLEGSPGHYRCRANRLSDGRSSEIEATVAIAAHGSWTPLPKEREERRAHRKKSDLFAFKANFRDARLEAGLLPVLSFKGGYGGMVLADRQLTTLACCIREDALAHLRKEAQTLTAGDALEQYLKTQCGLVETALAGASRDGSWLASGPLHPGAHLATSREGTFSIGNAAGEAHPIIGEGMSMAIQSAWLVAGILVRRRSACFGNRDQADAIAHAQRDYVASWYRHFQGRIRLAALFARMAMRPAAFEFLMPLLERAPGLLTYGARLSGKVSCAVDSNRIAALGAAISAAGHEIP